ncbi:MAG TPA: CDP-diacylglycerol--serine O-phosphatidyltransferase [Rhizomicrobium sp.]|nr:CDP-diacylglycerol--serine O-phosphatidyltransferase [Rhizomicrobium sp.]
MARIPRPDRERIAGLSEEVPITRFIPSAITLLGLCSGATAIPFAMYGSWKWAMAAIVCAAVLDTMDGWVARLIGAGSEFGAQLDSLSDLVSFGIAPSVLVYMWTLDHAGGAGWIFVLLYCVCCAIRLARFNIESGKPAKPAASHFTGLPTPAAACLILLPLQFTFQFQDPGFRNPFLTAAMIAVVSALMVSRIPTLSLKRLNIPTRARPIAFGFLALIAACAIFYPWATLTTALLVYLATIPVGVIQFAEARRKAARLIAEMDD